MNFFAHLEITPNHTYAKTVELIESALEVRLARDESGKYEEFPAHSCTVLGLEVAVLGIPGPEHIDASAPLSTFTLLAETVEDSAEGEEEVDISLHLCELLADAGLTVRAGDPSRA